MGHVTACSGEASLRKLSDQFPTGLARPTLPRPNLHRVGFFMWHVPVGPVLALHQVLCPCSRTRRAYSQRTIKL